MTLALSYTAEEIARILPLLTPSERAELDSLLAAGCTDAAALEARGWEAWYSEIFGSDFVEALAPHHREAVEWHWDARMAQRRGEEPANLAYFSIWSRGHMKSTLARRMAVCDACLSVGHGGGYLLYVSASIKKVKGHAVSIEALLTSGKVKLYYPSLSEVRRNERGGSKGWTGDFIYTEAGYVLHFIGLDQGVAGANVENIRPTLIIPDDVDDREDSPVISENRFRTLTTSVLPTRQKGTLVFFAQNLISRFSVMYRIWKGRARVLTNRLLTDPIPAIRGLVTEVRTVGGIVRDIIVAGEPTWHKYDRDRCQEEIDTIGLDAFLRECQHEVEQSKEGLVLQNWRDEVQVISRSEFASVYGTRDIPQRWYKYVFNDWAKTKNERHANVAGTLAVAGMNEPLPGAVFLFNPLSFPANTQPEDVALRFLKTVAPQAPVGGSFVPWENLVRDSLMRTNLDAYLTDAKRLIEERRAALSRVLPSVAGPLLQRANYVQFRGSHEQANDALFVYREAFGIPFHPTNPGGEGGVEFINQYMKVDYSAPHPFRPGEMGYTRYFLVAEDDMGVAPRVINGVEVYPPTPYNDALSPDALHDADLCRFQFANCRRRDPKLTEAGEEERGILKISDDFINGHMMHFFDNSVRAAPLTKDEKVMAMLPEKLQPAEIAKVEDPHERARRLTAQVMKATEIQKQHFTPKKPRNALAGWRSLGKGRR